MRTFVPSVKPYGSGTFVLETRVSGKRRREFFKTKSAAEDALRKIKIKIRREGEDALALPDALRVAAIEGQKQLEPFGRTLTDAINFYVEYLRDSERSVTVTELAADFMADQERRGHSFIHKRDLHGILRKFKAVFGDQKVRLIKTKDIQAWLDGLRNEDGSHPSACTVNNHRDRMCTMFNYATKHGFLDKNPVEPIGAIKLPNKAPQIFTVDEVAQLLNAAPQHLVPLLALGAFAGIRTAELLRLSWEDIDLARGHLNIPASKAKSAKRRLIVMEPCLREWLRPYAGSTGLIWPWQEHRRIHAATSLLSRNLGVTWTKNALRHSFASYHLAKYQNAPRTSLDMGHATAQMIFQHYREVVTPEEAERYWQIFPPAPAENVVPLAAIA
jgi:integrase